MVTVTDVTKKTNLQPLKNAGQITSIVGSIKEKAFWKIQCQLENNLLSKLFSYGKLTYQFSRGLTLLLLFYSIPSRAIDVDPVGNKVKEGVKNYRDGNFPKALDSFQKAGDGIPEDKRVYFNKGTALYKMGDYKSALSEFEKSASTKDDPDLKARSLYNMGNTYYKMGDKISAIKSYLDSLNVSPDFEPSKKNLELIQREEQNKDKKENQSKDENDKENNEKNSSRDNSPTDKESSPEEMPKNEKMKREEAERILESARQDKIKRRKMQNRRPDRNEIFW